MKQNRLLTLIAATLMSSAALAYGTTNAYDSLILNDGAYDYWPMQETTGPIFYDLPGTNNGVMYTSTDAGGAGSAADTHSAFIVAGANSTDGGTYLLGGPGGLAGFPSDLAVYFTNLNEQTSNSDIVISVYNTAMDSQIFSAEAWIYVPTYPVGYTNQFSQCPLGFEDNGGNQAGWYIGVYSDREGSGGSDPAGTVFFNLAHNTHSGFTSVNANTAPGGLWVHAVEVYTGANLQCYVNGVQIYNSPATYDSVTDYGGHLIPMIIGSYCESYFAGTGGGEATGEARNDFWHGGIAHVALYHAALTAGQVFNHYYMGAHGMLPPEPQPVTQPVGLTNYVGYSPVLSASFSGFNLAYQWFHNSTMLPGQTNQTLTLHNLVLSNAGTYYLQASNTTASVNTSDAVVGVLSLPSDPYQSNVIQLLPVAYYPLQETGIATNDVTVAADLIEYNGANDNGTYAALDGLTTPLLGQPGPGGSNDLGASITLNGSIPNGIFINDPTAMDITGNSTMEVWIQVQDEYDLQNIIMHGPSIEANPSKTANYLGFDGAGDYYVGRYQQTAFPSFTDAYYPVPANDVGNWVYLVGTSDGVAWHLYRNAQEVANLADTNGAIAANGGWAIGARNNMAVPPNNVIDPDGGLGLTASINNVALYNYALTPGQILTHYQVGLTGAASPVGNPITIQSDGLGDVILGWQYGTLQQAASVSGPWTDVVLALSPSTVAATNTTSFFRAIIK